MKVILYSTHCPMCRLAERRLKDKGIEYTEINDIDAMTARGFTHVPVLEVNGDVHEDMEDILEIIDNM